MIDAEKSLVSSHLVEFHVILESSDTVSSLTGVRNRVIICSSSKVCVNWMLLGFHFPNSIWETLLWTPTSLLCLGNSSVT